MEALKSIGLAARAPVDPAAFADAVQREARIADKGMTVFSMYSAANPLLILDLFVRAPIPFEELWSRSRAVDLGSLKVQVASIDDLIAMKRAVARPQDISDIEALEAIKERASKRDSGA